MPDGRIKKQDYMVTYRQGLKMCEKVSPDLQSIDFICVCGKELVEVLTDRVCDVILTGKFQIEGRGCFRKIVAFETALNVKVGAYVDAFAEQISGLYILKKRVVEQPLVRVHSISVLDKIAGKLIKIAEIELSFFKNYLKRKIQ